MSYSAMSNRPGRRLEVTIRAPRERVWWACSTLDGLSSWQADEVSGRVEPGASLELRWPELALSASVTVEELATEDRIVFSTPTWRLTVELTGTGIAATWCGPTSRDEEEGAASGWALSLALLQHQLEQHWGRSRHSSWVVRPMMATSDQLHVFFTEPAALASWLGTPREPLDAAGRTIELGLAWGERLTGRVLACTPNRDIAISWNEQADAVLSFRSVPSPRAPGELLVLVNLSHWQPLKRQGATRGHLESALQRLGRILERRGTS